MGNNNGWIPFSLKPCPCSPSWTGKYIVVPSSLLGLNLELAGQQRTKWSPLILKGRSGWAHSCTMSEASSDIQPQVALLGRYLLSILVALRLLTILCSLKDLFTIFTIPVFTHVHQIKTLTSLSRIHSSSPTAPRRSPESQWIACAPSPESPWLDPCLWYPSLGDVCGQTASWDFLVRHKRMLIMFKYCLDTPCSSSHKQASR